ncbi:MAG: NAC domain-containing protein, partial [Candidatus Thermoplasmatota archaeon]
MNPKQLKMAMKRLGVETEEIADVEEVVIRTSSKDYVFKSVQVTAMTV